MIADFQSRKIPAYGLVQRDSSVRIYAGAFDTPDEAALFKAALNLASNRLRARRLKSFLGLGAAEEQPAPSPSAPEELEREQRRRAVRRAIDGLPAKLKQVVVMCELSGLSYEEIAAALQIPVGTVGSRRSAALEKLSSVLGALEDT